MYCILLKVGIRNAFNTTKWTEIMKIIYQMGIPIKYYSQLLQSSVLVPMPCNLLYNSILEIQIPNHFKLIAYVDDLTVVGTSNDSREIEEFLNHILHLINMWLRDKKLEMTPEKARQ